MIDNFNLLATTSRGNERIACAELSRLLQQMGDACFAVDRSGITGLIVAKIAIDQFEAIRRLRVILEQRPYEFRYLLRIIPIEMVTQTGLNEIRGTVDTLARKIGEKDTFRVTIKKRFTTISAHDIIKTVAEGIRSRVDLEKPDKILLIEIVGRLTGLSVITPNDILSVMKEKII